MTNWEAGFCPNCNRNLTLFYVAFTLLYSHVTVLGMHFFEKLMLSTCGAREEQRTLQQSGVHEALLKVSILEYFSLWLWPHKRIFFCTLQTNNLHKKVSITDSGNERGCWEMAFFLYLLVDPFLLPPNYLIVLFVCLCFFAAIGLMKECMTIHKTLIHLKVLKDFLTIKDRYVSKSRNE